MNRKGLVSVGIILLTFVGIIVGIALFSPGISQPLNTLTTTQVITNQTVTLPTTGNSLLLTGQRNITPVIITNRTSGAIISDTTFVNFTVFSDTNNVNGLLRLRIQSTGSSGFQNQLFNVSYGYEPEGYVQDSGSRSVVGIIAIFIALAIVIIALTPAARSAIEDLGLR